MTGFRNSNDISKSDYTGRFVGTVKDNNDPEQRQRIKVFIPKLLEAPTEYLPWIAPILTSDVGMTSSSGVMSVPPLGSSVVVEFQNGDLNYGLYVGYTHDAKHTPDASLLLNYPNRRGYSDRRGIKFWVDNTAGQVELHWQHPSGTFIHVNNAGEVLISNATKVTVNTAEALVTASSSATITTPTANINASSQLNITSPNTLVTGNLTVVGDSDLTGDFSLQGDLLAVGSSFKHNGTNVGSSHIHGGVRFGGDLSAPPIP